jgi:hypothetical protein
VKIVNENERKCWRGLWGIKMTVCFKFAKQFNKNNEPIIFKVFFSKHLEGRSSGGFDANIF